MRLFYSFLKKHGLPKIKRRANSKLNRIVFTQKKTAFFGASVYHRISLLSTLCNHYLVTYDLRSLLFLEVLCEDLDKTNLYSLNLVSKKSVTGYMYAAYATGRSKGGLAYGSTNSTYISKSGTRSRKHRTHGNKKRTHGSKMRTQGSKSSHLLPGTVNFVKYSSKALLKNFGTTIGNANTLLILSLLGNNKHPFYKPSAYRIKKTFSYVRNLKKEPFYRYHILVHIVKNLSRFLLKKGCVSAISLLNVLCSKLQRLGNLISVAITLQNNKTL
jgi:hypothetical protein